MADNSTHSPRTKPASNTTHRKSGVSPESMRNFNLRLLADAIVLAPEPPSRAELARTTHLNKSTVARLVDYLIKVGLVVEDNQVSVGTGRPVTPLRPAPHTHVAIGAEIGVEGIEACVLDLTGDVIAEEYIGPVFDLSSPNRVISELAATLESLTNKITASKLALIGIACGVPGIITKGTGIANAVPSLGWSNVDIRTSLTNQSPVLPVTTFDNSVSYAAIAENVCRTKLNDETKNYVYVTGTSGLGAALIEKASLHRGVNGWSGEIGHTPAEIDGPQCPCGLQGCLELFAGPSTILRAAGLPTDATIGHLLSSLSKGERIATRAIGNASTYLSRALATYISIVDVQDVILGGFYAQLYDHFSQRVEKQLNSSVLTSKWKPIRVNKALVETHATSIGAAWQCLSSFIQQPENWQAPSTESLEYVSIRNTNEIFVDIE